MSINLLNVLQEEILTKMSEKSYPFLRLVVFSIILLVIEEGITFKTTKECIVGLNEQQCQEKNQEFHSRKKFFNLCNH
jgi:hypothetical protein